MLPVKSSIEKYRLCVNNNDATRYGDVTLVQKHRGQAEVIIAERKRQLTNQKEIRKLYRLSRMLTLSENRAAVKDVLSVRKYNY